MPIVNNDETKYRIDSVREESIYRKMGYKYLLKKWINDSEGTLTMEVISYHKTQIEADNAKQVKLSQKI